MMVEHVFEFVGSKNVLADNDSIVSLHKANCRGAKKERHDSSGEIYFLIAQNLEEAKKETFTTSGLEETGWTEEAVKIHDCCKHCF